jgi:energy-coupling factor transporter ATP-binding protein EcfA2
MQLLYRINRMATILMVTHDRDGRQDAQRVIALEAGRLVRDERRGVYGGVTRIRLGSRYGSLIGANLSTTVALPSRC